MGRLFQYNRFGNIDANNKKDNAARITNKTKKHSGTTTSTAANKCPIYAELYPDYNLTVTCTTATTTTPTTTTTLRTTTAKNMELAYKKYQQWGSKFLHTMTPAATATAAEAATPSSTAFVATFISAECSSSNKSAHPSEHKDKNHADTVQLMEPATTKRPRVYDCMKDFLRRKFFQQQTDSATTTKANHSNNQKHEREVEDDVTSDYDELDILDSSYNADEEDVTDCSCSYNSDAETTTKTKTTTTTTPKTKTKTKTKTATRKLMPSSQKSLLSLTCWQTTADSSSSSSSSNNDTTTDDEVEAKAPPLNDTLNAAHDDSDAGISDCCQLIKSEHASPQRRSPKRLLRKKQRKTQPRPKSSAYDQQNLPELMAASWYQPCISTKAAVEYLQHSLPGTFLIRRKAKYFELCLRAATKVKHFPLIAAEDCYKLKGARKQFSSLKALVTHHSVMAEQLPLTLMLPREEQNQLRLSVRCADDFDSIESLQILDILKSLQAKHLEAA